MTTTTLADLHANPIAGWQAVIADIATQIEADQHINRPDHAQTARFPDAAEAAFIRARDRTCRTPAAAASPPARSTTASSTATADPPIETTADASASATTA